MIGRRRLLAGSLSLGASLHHRLTRSAAQSEIEKSCYVVWAYGSGNNWWPTTHFTIYAFRNDALILRQRQGKTRVRVPYWTRRERRGFIFTGGSDTGCTGDGYRFGRGDFSVFVPGPRQIGIALRVTAAHTDRSGKVTHLAGTGGPGQVIRLRSRR